MLDFLGEFLWLHPFEWRAETEAKPGILGKMIHFAFLSSWLYGLSLKSPESPRNSVTSPGPGPPSDAQPGGPVDSL